MGGKCQEMDTFVILVGYRELQKNSGVGGGEEREIKILWKIGNNELGQPIILPKRTLITLWLPLAYYLITL